MGSGGGEAAIDGAETVINDGEVGSSNRRASLAAGTWDPVVGRVAHEGTRGVGEE
jgi:hypothetical protein